MSHKGLEKKNFGEKNSGSGSSLNKNFFRQDPPREIFSGAVPSLGKSFRGWVRSGEVSAAARPGLIPSIIEASPTPRLVRANLSSAPR